VPALVYILLSIALAVLAPWRPEPVAGDRAGAASARCRAPSQPKRTFVGFRDQEVVLRDFEPTALEATRILKAVKQQSCGLGEREDSGGRLRKALGTRPMEIASVLFEHAELTEAAVQLRQPSDPNSAVPGPPTPTWTLRVVCDEQHTWQVVSSSQP
jgi:hypothetical protein